MEAVSDHWEWGAYERRLLTSFILLCSLVFGLALAAHSLPKPQSGPSETNGLVYQSSLNTTQYAYSEMAPLQTIDIPKPQPAPPSVTTATATPTTTQQTQPKQPTTQTPYNQSNNWRNFLQKLL